MQGILIYTMNLIKQRDEIRKEYNACKSAKTKRKVWEEKLQPLELKLMINGK